MILGGRPRSTNPLAEVARAQGLILSPLQAAYRFYRRDGVPVVQARRMAREAAPQWAEDEMAFIMGRIRERALAIGAQAMAELAG